MKIRIILVLSLLFWFSSNGLGQDSSVFESVLPSGLPYIIVVESIMVNSQIAPMNTQVGVFADSLCVGESFYTDSGSFQITTWQGDQSQNLPGFSTSDSILFKLRVPIDDGYYSIEAEANFIEGNGMFGWGSFSAVNLTLIDSNLLSALRPPDRSDRWKVYPNPCKDRVSIEFEEPKTGIIEWINLDGTILWRTSIHEVLHTTIDLNFLPSAGGGIYLMRFKDNSGLHHSSQRILTIE